jgi:GntR family transcriptional regulator/MocR family aminotransferase
VVVYVGTLSKTLAPGLRLGFLAGPDPLLDAVARLRVIVDRQGDHATELAVATLVEDGTYGRHLRRTRAVYAARQRFLADGLREHLGDRVAFEVPMGGLALWVEAPHADVEGWAEASHAAGVAFDTARRYDLRRRPLRALRLGFAAVDEAALARALGVLALTYRPSEG